MRNILDYFPAAYRTPNGVSRNSWDLVEPRLRTTVIRVARRTGKTGNVLEKNYLYWNFASVLENWKSTGNVLEKMKIYWKNLKCTGEKYIYFWM